MALFYTIYYNSAPILLFSDITFHVMYNTAVCESKCRCSYYLL